MQYPLKFLVIAIAAIVFSVLLVPAENAAFDDALRDFLDVQVVKKVMDYRERTVVSRVVGCSMLLALWSIAVIAIDRIVDMATTKKANS